MAVVLLQTSLGILQREMVHLEDHGFLNGPRAESNRRFRLRRRRKRDSSSAEPQPLTTAQSVAGPLNVDQSLASSASPATASGNMADPAAGKQVIGPASHEAGA